MKHTKWKGEKGMINRQEELKELLQMLRRGKEKNRKKEVYIWQDPEKKEQYRIAWEEK